MFRLLKALPLTLALAALAIFASGCGSTSQSQVRVVHAIPDGPAVDIDVNGTKVITNLVFNSFQPASGYLKVKAGNDTVAVLDTGTTTQILSSSVPLNGSTQYTVVAAGFLTNPSAALITDNNAAPTSGNIEFRVIHASPSGTHPVDVYIVPPLTDITGLQPQISGLDYQQGSIYVPLAFALNGYSVILTASGSKTPLFNPPYGIAPPTGSIRTLVLVDVQNGGAMSPTPLVLNDLN
jgi:hypothetical protein